MHELKNLNKEKFPIKSGQRIFFSAHHDDPSKNLGYKYSIYGEYKVTKDITFDCFCNLIKFSTTDKSGYIHSDPESFIGEARSNEYRRASDLFDQQQDAYDKGLGPEPTYHLHNSFIRNLCNAGYLEQYYSVEISLGDRKELDPIIISSAEKWDGVSNEPY